MNIIYEYVCVCVCVCVRARARACARACVRVRACVYYIVLPIFYINACFYLFNLNFSQNCNIYTVFSKCSNKTSNRAFEQEI